MTPSVNIRFGLVILLLAALPLGARAQDVNDYLLEGKAYIDAGQLNEAILKMDEALAVKQDARLYELRAEASFLKKDYPGADSDFQRANTLAKGIGEFGLARISGIRGDVGVSLQHLENNIGSQYRRSEKEILLDPSFRLIENTPEWRQFWKVERYSVFDRKIPEIEYYLSTGNSAEAMQIYGELEADYRGEDLTYYARALIEFSAKRYSDALTLLSKITSEEQISDKYLRLLARTQQVSGNAAGASVTYSRMINMGIIDASLYLRRAECYSKTGETQRALKDINRYLDLYPENREALSLAGKVAIQSGDNLKAIDFYSTNLKLHPGDPECLLFEQL